MQNTWIIYIWFKYDIQVTILITKPCFHEKFCVECKGSRSTCFLPCRSQDAAVKAALSLHGLLWLRSEEGSWADHWASLDCRCLSPVTASSPPLYRACVRPNASFTTTHHWEDKIKNREHWIGWASNSPAGVVNGGPVVTVHLRNGEAAVQELREQLSVPFTGTAVKGEVVHPLPISKKTKEKTWKWCPKNVTQLQEQTNETCVNRCSG